MISDAELNRKGSMKQKQRIIILRVILCLTLSVCLFLLMDCQQKDSELTALSDRCEDMENLLVQYDDLEYMLLAQRTLLQKDIYSAYEDYAKNLTRQPEDVTLREELASFAKCSVLYHQNLSVAVLPGPWFKNADLSIFEHIYRVDMAVQEHASTCTPRQFEQLIPVFQNLQRLMSNQTTKIDSLYELILDHNLYEFTQDQSLNTSEYDLLSRDIKAQLSTVETILNKS